MHHSSQGMYKKNILSKSLNIEVLKSTCAILLIFFFLVVGSRFVGYFEQASEGLIDPNIIFKVVFLRFPDFITLLMPLSFFLGITLTISRLYAESEIYGYFSAGLSKISLIKFLIPQSIMFFLITLVLSLYIAPYTKELSSELISIDTFEEQFQSIEPKKVIKFVDKNGFIYVEEKNDKTFRKVTTVISNEGTSSLVIANEMSFNDLGSSLDLKFKNGSLHQGILEDEVKIISSFGELKLPLDKEITKIKGLSLSKLFDYSSNSSNSEILWNISIPITIFVLLILGVTMSKVEPRQGRLSVMLPAIAIYILYLSLLILGRDFDEDNFIDSQYYFFLVHILFLIVGLLGLVKSSYTRINYLKNFKRFLKIIFITFSIIVFLWMIN
ncbi:LptF/LptG family permease [Gammaproteobacteria bacterium]|nr:LptF/LptG family permease [Gammaproteobacteria bacterium]